MPKIIEKCAPFIEVIFESKIQEINHVKTRNFDLADEEFEVGM
jgi:hypothetical protein